MLFVLASVLGLAHCGCKDWECFVLACETVPSSDEVMKEKNESESTRQKVCSPSSRLVRTLCRSLDDQHYWPYPSSKYRDSSAARSIP